jgi:DNA-binding CsgD family transcriptional regulator
VRKHLENIYAKLGVNTRTAAIAATRPETAHQSGRGLG